MGTYAICLFAAPRSDNTRIGLPLGKPLMVMKDAPGTRETARLIDKLAEEKADMAAQSLQEIASLDSSFCVATPGIRDAVWSLPAPVTRSPTDQFPMT